MPADPRREKIEFARRIAGDVRAVSSDPFAARHRSGIGSLCTAIELLADALLMEPTLTEALLSDESEGLESGAH